MVPAGTATKRQKKERNLRMKAFRKFTAAVLAFVITVMPMSAMAAGGVDVVRTGGNVTTPALVEYIPKFAPMYVTAKGSGSTLSITANTTTSPVKVQIQYSTDKTFKKNVTTKMLNNKKYKSTVFFGAYTTNTSRGKVYTTDIFSFPSSVKDKNVAAAALEMTKKSKSKHSTFAKAKAYAQSKEIVALTRKHISASSTYTIKLANPKKYSVRIRCVYVDNNIFTSGNKRYYSAWKTVKVG